MKDLIAGRGPAAVIVEVHPGVQFAANQARVGQGHGHEDRIACCNLPDDEHTVLVIRVGGVIPGGARIRLAIGFRILKGSQAEIGHNGVPCAVVGQQGGIRCIGVVAPVLRWYLALGQHEAGGQLRVAGGLVLHDRRRGFTLFPSWKSVPVVSGAIVL